MERETKWLFGAIVFAAIGFFVPLYFGKIWLGLFITLVTGFAFLGRLLSLSKNEIESTVLYRIVYGLVALIVLFNAIAFAHDYGMRDYQKDLLLEIRKTIDSGIVQSDVQEKLVYVLGQYHQKDRESVVATFRDLMAQHLGEDGVYVSDFDLDKADKDSSAVNQNSDDHISYFYEIDEEADQVKIIAVTEIPLGADPEYENYDGQKGEFEMVFILNEEGVNYEIFN